MFHTGDFRFSGWMNLDPFCVCKFVGSDAIFFDCNQKFVFLFQEESVDIIFLV